MASDKMVPSPDVLNGPDDWIRRYYDFFLQRGDSRPGHVVDGQGGPSVSERELIRLRDFYHGLTEVVERCQKQVVESNGVVEGLMGITQEHLSMLSELEQQNADLRKENRNLKERLNQELKEDDRCKPLLSV